MDTKACRTCGVEKPLSAFYRKGTDPDRKSCKECSRARLLRHHAGIVREPETDATTKRCSKCGETLPVTQFHRNKYIRDGRNTVCAPCCNTWHRTWRTENNEHLRAHRRRKYSEDPQKHRDRRLNSVYGLEPGTYERMLAEQGGGCAICSRTVNPGKTRMAFDHCHETGKIRGLLCTHCNQAIGQLQDSPEIIRKAALYIERSRD